MDDIKVGIDTLAFIHRVMRLDLHSLAEVRGIDADKYHIGLGQYAMSVPPPVKIL